MGKIRVLLADDSAFARGLLRNLLDEDGDAEVVGEATNGAQAVRLAAELEPDLITMAVEMPVMGGLEAITEIMATHAVPILVVSSDAQQARAAVACGALDAINMPNLDVEERKRFVAKVKMLAKIRVITHMRPRTLAQAACDVTEPMPEAMSPAMLSAGVNGSRIFAIASSTGGPQVLAMILAQLPAKFPCPVLISQHISDGFAAGMANWLDSLCKLPVRLALGGEPLMPGAVYISPSEANLSVSPSRRVALAERLPGEIYRPNCDVLLASVADTYRCQAVGIILTGMGNDGAAGIAKIHQAGGVTLAQDEASSAIFGMNKMAIERGGVQRVLPSSEIPKAMCRLAGLAI